MSLRAGVFLCLPALLLVWWEPTAAQHAVKVRWEPRSPQQGDPVVVLVSGPAGASAPVGSLGARALAFFPHADGYAALAGIDVEVKPGRVGWRIRVAEGRGRPFWLSGTLSVRERKFPVQRLTLPRDMVDLDPPTLRRVEEESTRLRAVYSALTPERLWRGRFIRPVETAEPGEGFGARRIINDQPRAPHTGVDYSAEAGTPVVAANSGRVALVADYFFPGRLVILDHGLGLYTLYFHLARVDVEEGGRVERAQPIGAVGATGRATGPHLHFGAHLDQARIDPSVLLRLPLPE